MIEFFVPGRLVNPLNGSHGHWSKHRRWAQSWRERTAMALYANRGRSPLPWPAATPKRVTFTALVGARWDDDNLRAALKPVRDALRDVGLIQDDGPTTGHRFVYEQERVKFVKANGGVAVSVTLLPPAEAR